MNHIHRPATANRSKRPPDQSLWRKLLERAAAFLGIRRRGSGALGGIPAEGQLSAILPAIAHDARAPLHSIHGFAKLLTETDLQPEQAEWASRIQSAAQALAILLDSLVELGDRAPEDIEVSRDIVRPDLLLRETVALFEHASQDRGIEIRAKVDPSLLEYYEIDERKLRRILFHVTHNAVKYTARGEVLVSGHAEATETGDTRLIIEVADTGPGVPPADRNVIFEKFRRGHGRMVSSDGLGIGLFVSRLLARRLGGDVQYRDREGGGSIFTISVATDIAVTPPTASALRGRAALLVGFEAAQRTKLTAALHRLGLIAETATDGFLGLGMAERMRVTRGELDVVFLDDGLVGMPPEVFIRRLHGIEPCAEIPVVLVLRHGRATETDTSDVAAIIRDDVAMPDLEHTLLKVFRLSRDASEPASEQGARVLVVEDNHVNRTLFVEILRRAGHSVFNAPDAATGLNIVEKLRIDLIVLDLSLPGMSGVEMARRLKESPATRDIPIVVVTAHEDTETLENAREAGVHAILPKPFDSQRLLRTLEDALRRRRLALPADGDASEEDEIAINPVYIEAMYLDSGPARSRLAVEEFVTLASRELPRLAELLAGGIAPTDLSALRRLLDAAENLGAVQIEGEAQSLLLALERGETIAAGRHAETLERLWEPTRIALLRALDRCKQRYARK